MAEQAEIIQTILAEKEDIARMVDALRAEISGLESVQSNMGQELDMTKDKLTAAEQCKEMLRGQLDAATSELEECRKKMSVQCSVANELTGRLAQTEYEKGSFNEVVIGRCCLNLSLNGGVFLMLVFIFCRNWRR